MPKVMRADGLNKCIGCFTCMLVCAGVNHQNHSFSKSAIRIKTTGGLTGKFVSIVCLACREERACMEACPTQALKKRQGGGVLLQKDLCIGCKKCVAACIVQAVHYDEEENLPIICRHCGSCVRMCPHECLRMEEVEMEDFTK